MPDAPPVWDETEDVGPSWDDTQPVQLAPDLSKIQISPYDQAAIAAFRQGRGKPESGMESGTELTAAVASDPVGFAKSIPSIVGGVMMAPGKLAYAGAADVVSAATGDTVYGGNLASMQRGEDQLPAEKMIGSAAQASPKLAVGANIAKSIAEMAPLLGMSVLPASINRIAAGAFSLQMIAGVKTVSRELGAELGKPEEDRDAGKIASLKSDLIQTGIFAPLAGAGAASGLIKPRAAFQGPLATGEMLRGPKGAVPSPETQAAGAVSDQAADVDMAPPTTLGPSDLQAAADAMRELRNRPKAAPVAPEGVKTAPKAPEPAVVPLGEATKASPHDFEPALNVDGKLITGGDNHDAIKAKALSEAKTQDERNAINEAFMDDSKHVFVGPDGKPRTREQVSEALGEKDPMQSAHLRELQANVSAVDLLKMTPGQITAWKKRAKYGPELMQKMADAVKPEDIPDLVAERDLLRKQISDSLKAVEKGTLEARMKAAQSVQLPNLKAQTLNEMIEHTPKSAAPPAPPAEPVIRESRTTPSPAAPPAAKEPWQMTRDKIVSRDKALWRDQSTEQGQHAMLTAHRKHVIDALREGKPVPPEVLAEYPDLAPSPETAPEKAAGGTEQQVLLEVPTSPAARSQQIDRLRRYDAALEKQQDSAPDATTKEQFDNWDQRRTAIQTKLKALEGAALKEAKAPMPAPKPSAPEMAMAGPGSPSVAQGPDVAGQGWPQSANEDIMGVRQVTREKQAAVGQPVVAQPGEGTNLAKSLEDGRARLAREPAAADHARDEFDRTGKLSPADFNLARAKYEQVMANGRKVAEKFGTDSPEYDAARMEAFTWSDLTKRMQTEWHKMGMGQQGETDIDTGSVLDLEEEYHRKTEKEFTPYQRKRAERVAKVNKAAHDATETAKQKFNDYAQTQGMSAAEKAAFDAANKTVRESAAARAARERKLQGDPTLRVWTKAKEYLDAGMDNFDDIRKKLATDLGMPIEQVTRLLQQDERAKYLADDLWRKQQKERTLKSQAKRWVQGLSTPGYIKALQNIPRAMFGLKVGFHGTVALGTHAPMVAFQPQFWATYVRDFGKMYKMVNPFGGKGKSYYENQIQDLMRRDNYITANRAGLINDPFVYEDYNSPDTAKYFAGLTGMGNRGYSVLKILRQDMFDQHWNKLPKTAQIPEVAKAIADGINHATGVVKGRAPRGTNLALFAPRLEASRVMWLAGDPVKAVGTLLRWNKASIGEKHFAMNQLKEKLWVAGTFSGLLALNAGFLKTTGSDQTINMTDPFKPDFLKFKVAGMNVSYGNPMITMARLPLRLFVNIKNEGKLNKIVYEDENVATTLFEYVRSQMSPFAGTATDLAIGRDFMRKPLPRAAFGILPGKKHLPKRLRAEGVKPYTWPEYTSEQGAMIPLQEGIKEVWGKGFGLDAKAMDRQLKFLATIIVMSGTGARVSEDYSVKKKTSASNVASWYQTSP